MKKYDPKGTFTDPVVRCDKCLKIIKTNSIAKFGRCKHCGGRKVSALSMMNEQEFKQLKDWGIDPDYIALWEGVEDE